VLRTTGDPMPITITFEISDVDLEFFRDAFQAARAGARGKSEEEILGAARRQARAMRGRALPSFVADRIVSLDLLTRMLEDAEWKLERRERERVVHALAYFAEPVDLVPDQIPGLGFLDDAIMVELLVEEMSPEIEAYREFCELRDRQRAEAGVDPAEQRKRLEAARRDVYGRIERRREQRERRGGVFSIFS
jgi:uncharacterized membrane protein YkvA (DUF1232 family)